MNSLKISIITICYNSEKTIERTFNSVLSQTYRNFEYIVVDGASKDGTVSIIKKYEPSFNGRMRWISELDMGIYNAMNKGVMMATGDIVGLVNSDDWLASNGLESIVELVNKQEEEANGLYCGSMIFQYSDGTKQIFLTDKEKFYNGIVKYSLNRGAFHPGIYVAKKVYDEVGLFDERFKIAADIDFIYRCYAAGKKFYFTNAVVTNMADGGVSNTIKVNPFVKDRELFYTKRGISGWMLKYMLLKRYIFFSVKKFVPNKLLKIFRSLVFSSIEK